MTSFLYFFFFFLREKNLPGKIRLLIVLEILDIYIVSLRVLVFFNILNFFFVSNGITLAMLV